MTDPDTVGRALSALADDSSPESARSPHSLSHRATIAAARRAFSSLLTAAAFLDDDGESRLRAAVTRAAHAGDHDLAREGRVLLSDLADLRAALDGDPVHSRSAHNGFQRGRQITG
ncbi:hypothetical protein ACFQJC_12120 [Haloferax namakaokahaiae]|uniref:Uncharacterized protein n=1 Tax=Haloferax namakaokahaiae TaxID=1748331 RepID=A0ABD5ZH92_9EURY